jgi:hypothetical protein
VRDAFELIEIVAPASVTVSEDALSAVETVMA